VKVHFTNDDNCLKKITNSFSKKLIVDKKCYL